uniref:Uncharacterized protein n=1 Tax=Panagrolaimus sp. ES5 TaxID=591445 RepID=A0AC34GTI4_9BILA
MVSTNFKALAVSEASNDLIECRQVKPRKICPPIQVDYKEMERFIRDKNLSPKMVIHILRNTPGIHGFISTSLFLISINVQLPAGKEFNEVDKDLIKQILHDISNDQCDDKFCIIPGEAGFEYFKSFFDEDSASREDGQNNPNFCEEHLSEIAINSQKSVALLAQMHQQLFVQNSMGTFDAGKKSIRDYIGGFKKDIQETFSVLLRIPLKNDANTVIQIIGYMDDVDRASIWINHLCEQVISPSSGSTSNQHKSLGSKHDDMEQRADVATTIQRDIEAFSAEREDGEEEDKLSHAQPLTPDRHEDPEAFLFLTPSPHRLASNVITSEEKDLGGEDIVQSDPSTTVDTQLFSAEREVHDVVNGEEEALAHATHALTLDNDHDPEAPALDLNAEKLLPDYKKMFQSAGGQKKQYVLVSKAMKEEEYEELLNSRRYTRMSMTFNAAKEFVYNDIKNILNGKDFFVYPVLDILTVNASAMFSFNNAMVALEMVSSGQKDKSITIKLSSSSMIAAQEACEVLQHVLAEL